MVCREGKREIWRLGCKRAIKDTRVQRRNNKKKFVWVLYRKVAEPSHLFWRLRVVSYSKRPAAELETDRRPHVERLATSLCFSWLIDFLTTRTVLHSFIVLITS